MASLIFGVTADDPFTFTAIPLALIAAAALAIYIPARRATKIDPIVGSATSSGRICVLTIEHAGDFQIVAFIAEKHAVILSSQPKERRRYFLKLLDIAFASSRVARKRFEDL